MDTCTRQPSQHAFTVATRTDPKAVRRELTLTMSAWETYVDRYEESHAEAPTGAPPTADMSEHLHSNEAVSRFVAYAGPYLFWGGAAIFAAGVVFLP